MGAGPFQANSFQGAETPTATDTTAEDELENGNPPETLTQAQSTLVSTEITSSPDANPSTPTSTAETQSAPETAEKLEMPPPEVVTGPHASNQVIVKFKPTTHSSRIQQCLENTQTGIASEIYGIGALVLKVPDGEVGRALPRVRACAGVLYAEPNYMLQMTDTIPNDAGWGYQYGLVNIRAPQGWDLSTGSSAVTIAILDTGVDLGHQDLAGKMLAGYDFVNGDANPQDDNGHGTHVAGIAAAASNNGAGVAGVSWGARIMPVKVLDAAGAGFYADTAAGIIWAADQGAQVINLSLGGGSASSVLEDAVNYAYGQGVVLVAATGNTGSNAVMYPARYNNVIAVAATNSFNNRAGFSNYGPEVDVAAPGVNIYSTWLGGYAYDSGTSMSTPFVSGLAAILRGFSGNGSPDVIAWQMESTALDIEFAGWDAYTGYGLIQMDAAILAALPGPLPQQPEPRPASVPQYGQVLPSPTFTLPPASTQNPTETSTPEIEGPGGLTPTPTGTPTSEPEVIALDTAAGEGQEPEGASPSLLMPCLGILLVILGIVLFWVSGPMRRKNRHRSIKM